MTLVAARGEHVIVDATSVYFTDASALDGTRGVKKVTPK